ncbi:prephenate dehydrogenase [Saccharopolyspora rectivirgula]|jgi:prephenate dehydrogenase|uniref:Prephenate dehydrogenase n=1 Tax=Saccharopolyspora rectivirgula TaxID=28042 RepID=A0A073AW79_9PSEU|nr:prephenate dehydrogenase [Saccharopolyspora rectivirgula]KEI43625.1 prephenate dehydrogenase [Saccharopolyspora rectivirgula]
MRAVCVIGLGLIGGSVLRAAARAGRQCWGATASAQDAEAAAADGFEVLSVDRALRRASSQDALVVLAVPLPALHEVLREVKQHAPQVLLTDVTSVKAPVDAEIRGRLPQVRFAGGHPMAGTAESGWAAGSAELFDGAAWAVTIENETELVAWREACQLALDCGAEVVPTSAAAHDDAVARVSHLPHVFAAVLAATGADGGPLAMSLAAGSFRDSTRVAGSPPELVRAMTEGNRAALLDALDDALGRIGAARGSLASTGSLKSTIDSGYSARESYAAMAAGKRTEQVVRIPDAGALLQLRELGDQGARVVALDEESATVVVPV